MNEHLDLRTGFASEAGKRPRNEDYGAVFLANGGQRALRGVVAAIADGMGGAAGGREAAETTVRGFIDGYYGQPDTLGVERAAARALSAVNRWVHSQGQHDATLKHMATTFTALILRGRQGHVVHVGDTRLYRLREGVLACLTTDHTLSQPDVSHVLYRAVGIESGVRVDYAQINLKPHDRFLLCTDGVYGALNDRRLAELLGERRAPQQQAQEIVDAALAGGANDNASAVIVDVVQVPAAEQGELSGLIEDLPIKPMPKVGDVVDEFELLEVISDGRYSRLFRARDQREGREVVLKFPHPRVAAEATYQRAFVREAWIAARVHSPFVAEVIELAPGRRTALYSVMPYYRGETLEARIARMPIVSLKEGIDIALKLGRAIYALNRRQIIHRDIKPDNVILESGGLKLMDLGVARLPGFPEFPAGDIPGTPSYMAPELFHGEAGDERSDVYAYGVTLYRLFSNGQYPYGEVEPFSTPRFRRFTPLANYRGDLPAWLDAALAKACAVEWAERYGDAMEFAIDLENHLAKGTAVRVQRRTLYERNPVRFWQVVSLVLAVLLIIALAHV